MNSKGIIIRDLEAIQPFTQYAVIRRLVGKVNEFITTDTADLNRRYFYKDRP